MPASTRGVGGGVATPVHQPLGSRIQKFKTKQLLLQDKSLRDLYRVPKDKRKSKVRPLYKELLKADFYAKMDEETDDLPIQMVEIQSRKINLKARTQQVLYEELKDDESPLFAFVVKAEGSSHLGVRKKLEQEARQQSFFCRRQGKRYFMRQLGDNSSAVNDFKIKDSSNSGYSAGNSAESVESEYEQSESSYPLKNREKLSSGQLDSEAAEDANEWEVYNNTFKSNMERKTQIGPSFQVTATDIPCLSSLLKAPDARLKQRNARIEAQKVWDPNRLPQEAIDFFFTNIMLYWPYDLYKYSEDLALRYLASKDYDVELALAQIVVDLDDLVDLLRRSDDLLDRNLANFDFTGSKIYHAHLSVRISNDTNDPD